MITNFKIFESEETVEDKLVDELNREEIEKFYDEKYDMDIQTLLECWPEGLENTYDEDKFVRDFIYNYALDREFEDFDNYDFIKYIKDNITERKKKKIVSIYNEINDETNIKYKKSMLINLENDQLIEIMLEDEEEIDIKIQLAKNQCGDDADDILQTYYSDENGEPKGENLYNIIFKYIDGGDDALIKKWKFNEDFEEKKSYISNLIEYDIELQRYILNKNENTVLLFAELFKGSSEDISTEYKFQKLYIEKSLKKYNHEDSVAKLLKFLYDEFGLNSEIEKEYENDLWLINSEKYNL